VDNDVIAAIERHESKFGEFNATYISLNFGDLAVKQMFIGAIDQAIVSGVPISDKSLGIAIQKGIVV
jgi:hypothetical protein